MTFRTYDRVSETVSVSGSYTTNVALGNATSSNYITFASIPNITVGDTLPYAIVSTVSSKWETGIGTYSNTNTLTRASTTNSNYLGTTSSIDFNDEVCNVFLCPDASEIVLNQNGLVNISTLSATTISSTGTITSSYFNAINSTSTTPTINFSSNVSSAKLKNAWGGSIGYNMSRGSSEVDFINNYPAQIVSFRFYKLNASNVATTLASIDQSGNVSVGGNLTINGGNITGNASTASKLSSAQTIALSGDITGSTTFDGSSSKTITATLASSGVSAGSYTNVYVDTKGRVISGDNTSVPIFKSMNGSNSYTASFDYNNTSNQIAYKSYFINGTSASNAPSSKAYQYLYNMTGGDTSSRGAQLVVDNAPNLYFKELSSGNWNKVYHTGNLTIGSANGVATLDSNGKLTSSQIPDSLVGSVNYQGVWDANANSPTITSSSGTKGYYYKVNVSGQTDIDGISNWNIGDIIIYNGSTWDKIDGLSSEVSSVNGRVGAITISSSDITTGLGYTPLNINGGTITGTLSISGSNYVQGDLVVSGSLWQNYQVWFQNNTPFNVRNSSGNYKPLFYVSSDDHPTFVNSNANTIKFVNSSQTSTLVSIDEIGNVAMAGTLTASSALINNIGTNALSTTTLSSTYSTLTNVSAGSLSATILTTTGLPPGISYGDIKYSGLSIEMNGWRMCNGQTRPRTDPLWQYLVSNSLTSSWTYGNGDGSTTYTLPNLQEVVLAGLSKMGGATSPGLLTSAVANFDPSTIGAKGGNQYMQAHYHNVTDPGHNHTINDSGHAHGINDPGHAHGINDPGHQHVVQNDLNNYNSDGASYHSDSYGNEGISSQWTNVNTTGISIQNNATGISIQYNTTGISNNSSTTGISIDVSGSGSSNNVQPTCVLPILMYVGA